METSLNCEEYYNKILFALSFRNKLFGTRYLLDALVLYAKRTSQTVRCSDIYLAIANKYNTNVCNVEKAIRNSINDCFYNGRLSQLNKITGYNVIDDKYPPTNGELLSLLDAVIRFTTAKNNIDNLPKV